MRYEEEKKLGEETAVSKKGKNSVYAEICNIINKEFGTGLTEKDYELDLKESGVLSSIKFIKLLVELETRYEFEFDFSVLNDMKRTTIMFLGDIISVVKGIN